MDRRASKGRKLARILVVDDCIINIMALSSMLSSLGFESETCSNGLQAFEAVKDRHEMLREGARMYDLILMDFSMPECNGCEATRLIRAFLEEKEAPTTPFICCVTAYSE